MQFSVFEQTFFLLCGLIGVSGWRDSLLTPGSCSATTAAGLISGISGHSTDCSPPPPLSSSLRDFEPVPGGVGYLDKRTYKSGVKSSALETVIIQLQSFYPSMRE